MSAITADRIRIESPWPAHSLESFYMRQGENTHGCVSFRLLLEPGASARLRPGADVIAFYMDDEREPLFMGYVSGASLRTENGLCRLSGEAYSATWLMDREKKRRLWQDMSLTHSDIAEKIADEYEGLHLFEAEIEPIEQPFIQYEETDWEFLDRLAAMLNTCIVADVRSDKPRFWIGTPLPIKVTEFENREVRVVYDRKYHLEGAEELGFDWRQFARYEVRDYRNIRLFGGARLNGLDYVIVSKECEFRQGAMEFRYSLAHPRYTERGQIYNNALIGLSLTGTLQSAEDGHVRVTFDIEGDPAGEAGWRFPWRPVTGNILYALPEPGERVMVRFGVPGEESGEAVCVAETRGSEPALRGFKAAGGQFLLHPDKTGLISGDGSAILIDDETGVRLETPGDITITAQGPVNMEAA
ncbi:MAG: phage late control D family protein, partial [Gracilibacteraceae bacterium]|nr:phage late control D family protein [Gracilibacteraceae bacterium]